MNAVHICDGIVTNIITFGVMQMHILLEKENRIDFYPLEIDTN